MSAGVNLGEVMQTQRGFVPKKEAENNQSSRSKLLCFLILVTAIFQANLFAESKLYQLDASQSKLLFEVSSTLHNVQGQAKSLTGKVDFDLGTGTVNFPMQIEIMVNSMDTGNSRRDNGMRKMLQSEQYPVIRWSATQIDCRPGAVAKTMLCDAAGILDIRNIKREKKFQVSLTFHEGQIHAKGDLSIERKDFELKTPSLLGIVRVGQEVKIKFEAIWVSESV